MSPGAKSPQAAQLYLSEIYLPVALSLAADVISRNNEASVPMPSVSQNEQEALDF
jgi:hypothetical protein